jgi:hypothetical protein
MVLEPGEVFGLPAFSPREIGAEVERETIEEPFDELFAAMPGAAVAPATAARKPPASTTLGELYLAQGHLEEAEQAFREVLAGREDDGAARRGLEEIARRRELVAAAAAEETVVGWSARTAPASSEEPVLHGGRPALGRRAQLKIDALRDYLRRIGRGEARRVP